MNEIKQLTFLKFPLEKTIKTNLREITHLLGVYLQISWDGVEGCSFIYPIQQADLLVISNCIRNIIIPYLQKNLQYLSEENWCITWEKLITGSSSIYRTSLAIVDVAFWDILSKKSNLSLHHYLKGTRDCMPVYGTTGWVSLEIDALLEECESYRVHGVNGFKIRLGHPEDYERIKNLRKNVGPNFMIMADANKRYDLDSIQLKIKDLQEFKLEWVEEPLPEDKATELSELKKMTTISIATGENISNFGLFEEICSNQLISIIQPDILQCGGITGVLKVIKIAEKNNIYVCNHLMAELSAGIIGSSKLSYLIEYDNLLPGDIYSTDFSIKSGKMPISKAPGIGFTLNVDSIKRYKMHF